MPLMDEIVAKRELILASAAKHGLCDVRVFGSVARGEETPESDVDFLINYANKGNPLGFVDFQDDMQAILQRKVDVVFERGLHWYIEGQVKAEARPI
jgi:predicted nucleotidyltransferase